MKTYKELSDEIIGKRNNRLVKRRRTGTILISAVSVLLISALIIVPVLTLGGDDIVPDPLKGAFKPSPTAERNYDSLYSSLDKVLGQRYNAIYDTYDDGTPRKEGDSALEPSAPNGTGAVAVTTGAPTEDANPSDSDYSETNLQVVGVDEADIIKTDGKYFYVLTNKGTIVIAAANNGQLTLSSVIERETGDNLTIAPIEMYLTGNRLVVVSSIYKLYREEIVVTPPDTDSVLTSDSGYLTGQAKDPDVTAPPKNTDDTEKQNDTEAPADFTTPAGFTVPVDGIDLPIEPEVKYWERHEYSVGVTVYDVSDRKSPVKVNVYEQSGSYISSRMIDEDLYLLTQQYLYNEIEKGKLYTYVPQYTLSDKEEFVSPKDIFVNEQYGYSQYTNPRSYLVVAGVDTAGEVSLTSIQAVFGCGSTIYSSQSSIYTVAYSTLVDSEHTLFSDASKIYRFSINNGKVSLADETTLPGTVLNQFSMDEYGGYFRIATTSTTHRIYAGNGVDYFDGYPVFDGELAIPETTASTVNTVYVLNSNLVVIGQTEPLAEGERIYSVRFEGSLGYVVTFKQVDPLFAIDFSDPAQPKVMSELKIPGYSEYMQTFSDGLLFGIGRDAGGKNCIKLSMFDVSNSENVTELHTFLLEGVYYSPAEHNHKAILINAKKNLIAFAGETCYYIFSYSPETGFTQRAVIKDFNLGNGYYYYNNIRGAFIGDFFYVIFPNSGAIASYTIADFTRVAIMNP